MSSSSKVTTSTTSTVSTPASGRSQSDVLLVSSDNVGFRTQKVFLVAASEVFADMLHTGSDSDSTDSGSELPKIKLAEHSTDLKLFLKFVDRTMTRPHSLSLKQAEWLYESADKYDSPIVTDFARVHLRPRVDSSPATVFGVAVVFKDLDLAHEALAHFESTVKNQPELSRPSSSRAGRSGMPNDPWPLSLSKGSFRGYDPVPRLDVGSTATRAGAQVEVCGHSTYRPAPSPARKRTRDVTLSDVPIEYLRRFSAETIQSFTRRQDDERSWPEKASLFKIV